LQPSLFRLRLGLAGIVLTGGGRECGATGPSPPQRRRRIATASPAPQRGYYRATTRLLRELLLRGYYKATTRLLAIRLLPGYYQATTRPLPGYYQATTRLLPGAARAPLGQQHRSRSPARLPAPLNPAARSRRRRSAHSEKDLEEAVHHVPNKPANSGVHARHTSLSSRMLLESTPACTTDLADELEHVERAGLGQVHHDGAVRDEQAPAPASSSHGACAGYNLVPQQQCSTRQMACKPATSSSSNAVVGQKVARSTAEPASPHRRRHGRRERARQRRIASARIYLILSYLSYLSRSAGEVPQLRSVTPKFSALVEAEKRLGDRSCANFVVCV
jgi:hypothetical protein